MPRHAQGFVDEDTGANVTVVEVPADAAQVMERFAGEATKTPGLTLKQQKNVTVAGTTGLLLAFTKVEEDVTSNAWMLIFGDANLTTMISASFPPEWSKELSTALKECLLGVEVVDSKQFDPLDGLPYAITPTERFKFAKRIGNATIFSPGGEFPVSVPTAPRFMVGYSDRAVEVPDRKQLVEKLVRSISEVQNANIESVEAVRIGGLDGYEAIATAERKDSDTPICVYQVVLYESEDLEQQFIFLRGEAGTAQQEAMLEEFKTLAHSFQLNK